jgi:CHAD domain-containing protein
MGPSGKWIDGIDPDGSVVDAARLSLGARLTAVAHWLPLAAHHAAQDIEHVHRLRVSTRRAVAALRLYREMLAPGHFRWVKKRLKKIRRAAGEARDLDVLGERLRRELGEPSGPIVAEIDRRRAEAQPALIRVAEKCRRNDRFVRKVARLRDAICPPKNDGDSGSLLRFRNWAVKKLAETSEPFFGDLPGPASDVAALHQFRIRTKALRYAIELLAPAFEPRLRSEIYPQVEALQEELGRIQDCVAGGSKLRELRTSLRDSDQQAWLVQRVERDDERLARLIDEFHAHWSAERAETLKLQLAEIAGSSPASADSAIDPPAAAI